MSASQERWYAMSVDEIEDRLKTNTHTGLNSEDIKTGRRPHNKELFVFPELSAKRAAALVLNDVALYFFVAIAVFCAFFGKWVEAVTAILIIAANCSLAVYLKITSNKYENAVMAPSIPRCDVIRDGRIVSADARDIVVGDIVYLKPGDIAPCDLRIAKVRDFSVYEAVAGGEDGSLKYARSAKTNQTMNTGGGVPIGKIYNMVFANSMVTSGYAVGIAVATGKNTFLSQSHGGIVMTSDNARSPVDEMINRLFRFISFGLAGMIIPFVFISLFSNEASAGPIDYLIGTGSLALSIPLQTITVLFSTVMCCAVRMCGRGSGKNKLNYAILKKYASLGRFSDSGVLFLFGKSSVNARGLCVESIYSDLKSIGSPEDERTCDVIETLEHAYLVNKATYGLNSPNPLTENHEKLFLRTIKEYGGDIERLTNTGGYISYKRLNSETDADVAIISYGDNFAKRSSLVCRTLDRRIIDCAYWYTSNGVDVMLDEMSRDSIKKEYERLKSLGYEVITVAKATPKMYDVESFDDYEGQLIFEGMVAVGPVYAPKNAESAKELSSLGIRPIVCLEDESTESEYIVKNVFREIDAQPYIVRASEFKKSGESILKYVDADAFIGFDKAEIGELCEAFKKYGVKTSAVVVDFKDLAVGGKCDFIIGYSYDVLTENACNESYPLKYNDIGASVSSGKKYADMLVSPVTPRGGGLDGVLSGLKSVRSFFRNLNGAVSYMLCSLVARATVVYLPLLLGRPAMNSAMILYLGCIVDLLGLLAISMRSNTLPGRRESDSFGSIGKILANNTRAMLLSFLSALVISFAGIIIPQNAPSEMQAYNFIALLAFQLVTLTMTLLSGINKRAAKSYRTVFVPAVAVILLSLILAFIPTVGAYLGFCGGWQVYLRAGIVSLITAAVMYFFYYKPNSKE